MAETTLAGAVGANPAATPKGPELDSAARVPAPRERVLFIDATGALQDFGSAPTGIPRVEGFLVRAALAENDPAVVVVKLDRRRRAYMSLDIFEQRRLRNGSEVHDADIEEGRPAHSLRRVFGIIRQYPTIGRDADRHFADLATNSGRRGLLYHALKLLIRAYRLYRRCTAQITIAVSGCKSRPVDVARGTVLLSNVVVLSSSLSETLAATQAPAFVCHDLIPCFYPHFSMGADPAKRFATNIHQIMQFKDTTALCTSETSCTMLTEYARSAGIGIGRVKRFPMPSVLLEKAGQDHCASETPIREPFILFCSTIEARKNHLLLARIWQQAVEDGVVLPMLLCVGKWGWGVDDLIEYLAAHPKLASRITFAGPASDAALIGYYRSALFGVMPSRVEGWGYGASECLDFGIPVIVSTAPALREATCGLMPAIDPDDQSAWYAEIRRLSENEGQRAWYRKQIADRYRPTPTAASWAHIKAALRH